MKKIIFFIFFQTAISLAMCPSPEPRTRTEFTRCDVAFIGKVISKRSVMKKGSDVDGIFYTMKVNKLFRGSGKEFIEVYEDNDSARMGLEVNHTYLIFVFKQKDGRLQGWCRDAIESTEGDYQNKISEIKEVLKNINNGTNGEIIGFVGPYQPSLEDGIEGIHFDIEGAGKSYKVVSDKNGWFHLLVPAGHYKIKPNELNWSIELTDFCPEDPDDLDVRTAGGADLAFIAEKKGRIVK